VVEFADTGQGMRPAQAQRALRSVLRSTKRRGTGLGLAIVNRVVESHRGQLRLASQPGRGTTVSVILPV